MKSLLIAMALVLCFMSQTGFTLLPNVSPKVLVSFENNFKNVTNLRWSLVGELYKADFVMNGQELSSFYNSEGEAVATARKLNFTQLPISLQVDLQNQYSDAQFSDFFEINNEEGTSFYLTAQNKKRKLILAAHPNGQWSIYKALNRK